MSDAMGLVALNQNCNGRPRSASRGKYSIAHDAKLGLGGSLVSQFHGDVHEPIYVLTAGSESNLQY